MTAFKRPRNHDVAKVSRRPLTHDAQQRREHFKTRHARVHLQRHEVKEPSDQHVDTPPSSAHVNVAVPVIVEVIIVTVIA